MNDKIPIHTVLSKADRQKLLEYGKNIRSGNKNGMSDGIHNLIEIAESKKITIHIITEVQINEKDYI